MGTLRSKPMAENSSHPVRNFLHSSSPAVLSYQFLFVRPINDRLPLPSFLQLLNVQTFPTHPVQNIIETLLTTAV